MKQLDQVFADIARVHLFIDTLETRNSDSLDFHNVAVWCVQDALSAAYEAGARSIAVGTLTESHWTYRESEYDPNVWEIMADWCESPIAEVSRWLDEDDIESPDAKANLALIVASPRLLAACRLVVERWESGDLAEAVRQCDALVTEHTSK